MTIAFFLACVRVSSLAGKVSLWGCGDISPSCRTRKRFQFEKVTLASVPASSKQAERCISLQVVGLKPSFGGPKSCEEPTVLIPQRNSKHLDHHAGVDLIMRKGGAKRMSHFWLACYTLTSIWLASLPSICQTHANWLWCHRPFFILTDILLNARWHAVV